jgi:DNA-binding response OmpR family regulator
VAILLVDDDRNLVQLLSFLLEDSGFEVLSAYDTTQARARLRSGQIDLAVLDVNLGTGNGFDLLEEIRRTVDVPVIMLTGRSDEEDVVHGLELGADDYITKPFRHREFVARVRSHLQRRPVAAPAIHTVLAAGPITLDVGRHTVHRDGRPLALSVTEFRLLQYFLENRGRALSTAEILKQVWGYDENPSAQAVARVAVHRLRRKLGDEAGHQQLILTVAGIGFRFEAPTPA